MPFDQHPDDHSPLHLDACLDCQIELLARSTETRTQAQDWLEETSCHDQVVAASAGPTNANAMFEHYLKSEERRQEHIQRFGFAILTGTTVNLLARYQPILEIGAGNGYWCYEFKRAGVHCHATDPGTWNMYRDQRQHWTDVEPITGQEAVAKYPDWNILLAWPDFRENWPHEVVGNFKGEFAIYVGTGPGLYTGTEEMHLMLDRDFTIAEDHLIPKFPGMRDSLTVHQRLAKPMP